MPSDNPAMGVLDAVREAGRGPEEEENGHLIRITVISEWIDASGERSLFNMSCNSGGDRVTAWETVGLLTSVLSSQLSKVQ